MLFSDWGVTLTKRGCSTCVHAGDFLNIMVKKTKQGAFSFHFLRHPSFILIGCKSNHKKRVGLHFKASYFWNVLIVNFLNYLGIESTISSFKLPSFCCWRFSNLNQRTWRTIQKRFQTFEEIKPARTILIWKSFNFESPLLFDEENIKKF